MGCVIRPRPSVKLGGEDRPAAQLPDGPVPSGRCEYCRKSFDHDIYLFRGVVLCGDCRYYVRNGRWPNYERSIGDNGRTSRAAIAHSEYQYHGSRYGSGE